MSGKERAEQVIARLKSDLAATEKDIEDFVPKFSDELVKLVSEEIKRYLRDEIAKRADLLDNSGSSLDLSALKADMNQLLEKLPAEAFKLVESSSEWPHKQKEAEKPPEVRVISSSDQDFYKISFRRLLSTLGAVLKKHNILNNYWSLNGPNYVYRGGFPVDDLNQLSKLYKDKLEMRRLILEKLASAGRDLRRETALEAWDNA